MGYIKQNFIESLLERAHIDEVINRFLPGDNQLKRSGANLKAKSPFGEDRTASFMVSPAKNIWKDFSSGKGGTMVSFVMEKESCTYVEAIEKIAAIYNMPLEYEDNQVAKYKKVQLEEKEKLRKVLTLVSKLYKDEFKKLPEDHPAKKEVVVNRQYDDSVIIDWGIGYAPENFLFDKLVKSGYEQEGVALGLISDQTITSNKWDQYTKRVTYEIHDINGLLIGLGGRDVHGRENTGKWINPKVDTSNLLYNKSKVWYGIHKAKSFIRKRAEVFIVEGYNDVIAWHENGVENTVAPCGTAITSQQINELKKLTTTAVFCMDPDRAGRAAVIKQIPLFIKAGFRTEVIHLDLDPDDYSRAHKEKINSIGLLNILSTPGQRQDGFSLLVNEFIKKGYYELEATLLKEESTLTNYQDEFKKKHEELNKNKIEAETDLLEATAKLKEIELLHDKKHEAYIEQLKTKTTLASILEKAKHALRNIEKNPEHKEQIKVVAKAKLDFDIAYNASEIQRASGAKLLCAEIINVEDKALFEIYLNWIQKDSGIAKRAINEWIKELRSEQDEDESEDDYYVRYELPKVVKTPFKDLESDIKYYGMFVDACKIWMAEERQSDGTVNFSCKSNFEIEILQHMQDEKFPMKLIRIKNIHGLEKIFDTPSENLNTPQAFDNAITGHGNFRFDGNRSDLLRLRTFLFDKMGNGRKIDVLGHQPDGNFWVWNGNINSYDGKEQSINEHGIFIKDDFHYYIPSANKIYKNNSFKYDAQKRFRKIENPNSFDVFALKVKQVHRDHAISALLFGIASLFQDIVVDRLANFPILFFYGPGSSGKDELAAIVQSFVGVPQVAINLEGNVSTIKAQVREFAQFRNGISQLSEYKTGNPQLDGMLKALWDRRGYKRGNLESHVGTESIPIESSAILTGNQFPNEEPLILRLIWNEMTKNEFNQDEMKVFDELRDMREKGVSGYSDMLFEYRPYFIENFEKQQRSWKGILQELFPEAKSRIISNLSILASVYSMFKDIIKFPFTQDEMIEHFGKGIDQQIRKINSASILNRFWDCFVASLRGPKESRLQVNYIVSVKGNNLYMNWSHTYNKIQMEWITRYRELAPAKSLLKEQIEKSGAFIEDLKVWSFDEGRDANRTSAIVINLDGLSKELKSDIVNSIVYQMNEGSLWDGQNKDRTKSAAGTEPIITDNPQTDLPF